MWDAIVVGSGPAGAIAAFELARNGRRTIVIEKERLPRYKTCGGGLVRRSIDSLPFSITGAVERQICRIEVTNNFEHRIVIEKTEPLVLMSMRSELDHFLMQQAIQEGVEILEQVRVTDVSESESGVECRTSAGTFQSSFLIGADGANSIVAKSLGYKAPVCGVALEVEVSIRNSAAVNMNQIDFDFNVLPHGYGWVFPKASHLSCGVFTMHRSVPEIRQYYDAYITRKQFAKDISDAKLSGHLIPLRPVSSRLHTKRCLLAGDAGGLADPLTGEGISFALRSGRLAAQAVLQNRLQKYSEDVRKSLAAEVRLAYFLAKILYGSPKFVYKAAVNRSAFGDSVLDLFAGRTTYRELAKKLLLNPFGL